MSLYPTKAPPYSSRLCAWAFSFFGSLTALLAAGCGSGSGSSPENALSGKVSTNGKNVAGIVAFTGADNKEVTAPIGDDGTYQVKLPKGDYSITIKAMPGATPGQPAKAPPPAKDAPPLPSGSPDLKASQAVSPPAKYTQPGNGLKVTVTGGTQTFDIDLK